MSIPSDPSVSTVVTEGLKRGGRVSPSAGDITTASEVYLQEVKADIYLAAPLHESLRTTAIIPVSVGISRYAWPTNAETIQSVQLVATSTEGSWQDTAQGGGASTITLASTFNQEEATVQGRMIYILSGTGSGQYAQIISYNNTTKIATIETAWATLNSSWVSPDATSVYLLEQIRSKLYQYEKPIEFDTQMAPFQPMIPTNATLVGKQIWLNTSPSQRLVLFVTYWYALDQLDEVSTLFTGHLRKFRNLWTQGVAVKVMQRYDEDRYVTESNIYQTMLKAYAGRASGIGQVQFRDI